MIPVAYGVVLANNTNNCGTWLTVAAMPERITSTMTRIYHSGSAALAAGGTSWTAATVAHLC